MQLIEHHDSDEYTISLDQVRLFVRRNRLLISFCGIIALFIGILYAFLQKNEYTCYIKVMPELKTSSAAGGLNDLKSLAGLAGVSLDNLNTGSDAIRPDLYPDIVQSTPFAIYILNQTAASQKGDDKITVQRFLEDHNENTIGGWIAGFYGGGLETKQVNSVGTLSIKLTKEQERISKEVLERINTIYDKKTGIVTITVVMPNPQVASVVAGQTLAYLTKYVTDYRTGKSRQQVNFLSTQVNAARSRYEKAEYAVSNYRDRNRSVFLNTAKIEEQRLQADYLLAQTVYTELSKQLEQARIKVQEEIPVFQLLEPPRIPTQKSSPQRLLIIVGFLITGIILGVAIAFARSFSTKHRPIST
ncbi:GNVR domain-containing protein [uncultured Spirosoma sp.]|uniref:GNVR domain-containing protein n=1 Tax=uncultured Spirosoma sp. TaxID=278208 RepID=UPI00258FCAFE|nr:GNVR domain-containing protein [uncultured Spirosoma sp.]